MCMDKIVIKSLPRQRGCLFDCFLKMFGQLDYVLSCRVPERKRRHYVLGCLKLCEFFVRGSE